MTSEIPDDRQTINETLEKYFLSLSEEHELTLDEIRKIFKECDAELISGGRYKARQFMEIALVPAIERYKKVKQADES
jgi:hypothetical protein